MTDLTRIDLARQGAEQPPTRRGRQGRPAKYLPSSQVLEELVRLGPDLSAIADELRSRLSEPGPVPGG
ncbi:MAG TPA: hypothetical protein VMA72_20765 [Streptosporangiaceae bacterium]|nr:hypothetical protein [Streptosporangiaceae bacterium]